jgi:hypothetical protein
MDIHTGHCAIDTGNVKYQLSGGLGAVAVLQTPPR